MKTYYVYVCEENYGRVIVDAKNEEEARDKAYRAVEMGEANWNNGETTITAIQEAPELKGRTV